MKGGTSQAQQRWGLQGGEQAGRRTAAGGRQRARVVGDRTSPPCTGPCSSKVCTPCSAALRWRSPPADRQLGCTPPPAANWRQHPLPLRTCPWVPPCRFRLLQFPANALVHQLVLLGYISEGKIVSNSQVGLSRGTRASGRAQHVAPLWAGVGGLAGGSAPQSLMAVVGRWVGVGWRSVWHVCDGCCDCLLPPHSPTVPTHPILSPRRAPAATGRSH